MATKLESEYPPSPTNDESGGEERDVEPERDAETEQEEAEDEEGVDCKPPDSNSIVAGLLKRLESSGALLKKPKQEHRCFTCEESFPDWEELENHLIQHVSLPSVVIDKLPSDDEYLSHSGDENWSDEEDTPVPQKQGTGTPQKIDISQILKKTGISIKKTETDDKSKNPSAALDKLSGLGFTIKKNNTPIKQEKVEPESSNDVLQKLGKLGGLKLKLKSDGNNTNSFKVVNGLKDFKTSDDEGEESSNEATKEDSEDEGDREQEFSGGEPDSDEQLETDEPSKPAAKIETTQLKKLLVKSPQKPGPKSILEKELTAAAKPVFSGNPSVKEEQTKPTRPPGRPSVKQTPKRGPNNPVISREHKSSESPSPLSEPARTPPVDTRDSQDANMENIVIKEELDAETNASSTTPLFSGQIKTERPSSPIVDHSATTPILATVKSEPPSNTYPTEPIPPPKSYPPVTKTESSDITVIEINGDSNDEDDDCCVISTTPAPDVKPIIPKVENTPVVYPPTVNPTTQPTYSSTPSATSRMPGIPSLEKQHTFNWNAPDSKPPLEMLEKSADDIFESLLSASTKKESMSSLSEPSEYISLDTLGPQHTCDVCNTRFTDMSLLHDHIRMTGHSKSIITASPSTNLMPYAPQSNILSSLLPVKQLAEQVGKLSGMGSGPGFTHQQNVMINIQAYPGAGGMGAPGQAPYNPYNQSQNMHGGYGQTPNNMYSQGQTMPGQYPGQSYMGSTTGAGYDQYPSPMSKTSYSGAMPHNSFSPYSTASPMQNMQPSVYGQASGTQQMGMMGNQQMGQMGPPGSPYVPTSSSGGSMKPNSGVRIQNVQTFQLGQMMGAQGQSTGQPGMTGPDMVGSQVTNPGQPQGMQMPPPNQIRMAVGANLGGRPRAPGVRGVRPTVRPGVQVHGQVRGARLGGPRMPMKRPAGMAGGPAQKRRNDMLLPGKHDNEDCQVMSMQKQRDGLPLIHSVQGAKDKLNLGSQISITKKTVNKEANAMANVLASRGISVKQKQKSRSPSPERPVPRIPNLGAGMSIKHTSKSSSFNIPEAKVGGGMLACKICKKMFMNSNSLTVHMANAHPQHKVPAYKCDECPASYPTSLQLQHHKRVFHNVNGPNRELGLPVVDLSQEDNLKRLSNLGIYSFIPLANRELANGCFGIPVISVHNVQNGMTTSMQALGADGLLSLGPMKPLPNS